MKVLMIGRVDSLTRSGGDTKLMLGMKRELEKNNVESTILKGDIKDFSKYDLVHFFGIMRAADFYHNFTQAKKSGKSIVVTPIYENLKEFDLYGRRRLEKYFARILNNDHKDLLKSLARGIKDKRHLNTFFSQLINSHSKQQKEILESSDFVLASSKLESISLIKKFSITRSKIKIVPYCINYPKPQSTTDVFFKKYKVKNFVLSVGRIEPKKNQLGILKALKNTQLPIVFIGNKNLYHKSYVNEFMRVLEENPNARYLGYLDEKTLNWAYKAAKVHVLASWFEAPGLANMEAAINDCNVVTTAIGYAREYFKEFAWYCNPKKQDSIRKAITSAYKSPYKKGLKKRIIREYSWEKTVPHIQDLYKQAIKIKH